MKFIKAFFGMLAAIAGSLAFILGVLWACLWASSLWSVNPVFSIFIFAGVLIVSALIFAAAITLMG